MKASPTSRTLELLRDHGMVCAVVEKWNPHAKIRQDLYGFIDIVALDPKWDVAIGVQCTTGSNLAARVEKIQASKEAMLWSKCSNRIYAIGWRKVGAAGKRKLWDARILQMEYTVPTSGAPWSWVVFEIEPEAL